MLATQTPKHHHLAEDENGDDDDMTNGDNGSGGGDVSRDLETDEHIKDPVENRQTIAERNERLHDQLKVRMRRRCFIYGTTLSIVKLFLLLRR